MANLQGLVIDPPLQLSYGDVTSAGTRFSFFQLVVGLRMPLGELPWRCQGPSYGLRSPAMRPWDFSLKFGILQFEENVRKSGWAWNFRARISRGPLFQTGVDARIGRRTPLYNVNFKDISFVNVVSHNL